MEFSYSKAESEYLRRKDKKLAVAMDAIGPLSGWSVEPDIFAAIIYTIAGQQISTAVHIRLRKRIKEGLCQVTPESVLAAGVSGMKSFGLSERKAQYAVGVARATACGAFCPEELKNLPDAEVTAKLCALRGIGPWTAEMILIFSLERRDVLSFGDFGIRRGIRMLYRCKEVTPKYFERLRCRWSPCGTLASLYLWEIAGGAIPGLTDPARVNK